MLFLAISKVKIQNTIFFTLHYDGVTSEQIDIYRNGELWVTTETSQFKAYSSSTTTAHGGGKDRFRICEHGSDPAVCSEEVGLDD